MSTLDQLSELDNFEEYKTFIKKFILESSDLWKLIFYSSSNPLLEDDPENPYEILESSSHGCVLFRQKNDIIQNEEQVTILVNFTSNILENTDCISITSITFDVIVKGTNIQTLADGSNRAYKIAKLIDDFFNHVKVENNTEVKRLSFENLAINEQNCGYEIIYQSKSTSFNDEIKIYQHQQSDDEYGITRESYNLLVTTDPILVDIRPLEDNKETTNYGYDAVIKRRMVCDIIPEITESSVIEHEDIYYRIEKYVEYDDYMDYTLIEAKRVTIN